jgi:hypothetical protein
MISTVELACEPGLARTLTICPHSSVLRAIFRNSLLCDVARRDLSRAHLCDDQEITRPVFGVYLMLVTQDEETIVKNLLLKKLTSTEITKQTGIPRREIRLFRRSINQAVWAEREKKNIEKHASLLLDHDYRSYYNKSAFARHREWTRNQ